MNIVEIDSKFPTELDCIKELERIRWGNQIRCSFCNSTNIGERNKDYRFHCKNCQKSFSVTTGTKLHKSRIPMKTWFYAFSIISGAKKGVSALQLKRNLDISYPTAWKMYMAVRDMMKENNPKLRNIVEIDETYVGGKPRHAGTVPSVEVKKRIDSRLSEYKKEGINVNLGRSNTKRFALDVKRGRGTSKVPVVGLVEREGNVIAEVMRTLSYDNLRDLVERNVVKSKTVVISDDFKAYNRFDEVFKHIVIDHKLMCSYKGVNTNTIESFWAIVKRGIMGQYHSVSLKYLPKYVVEFVFKYNHRNDKEEKMTGILINQSMKNKTKK